MIPPNESTELSASGNHSWVVADTGNSEVWAAEHRFRVKVCEFLVTHICWAAFEKEQKKLWNSAGALTLPLLYKRTDGFFLRCALFLRHEADRALFRRSNAYNSPIRIIGKLARYESGIECTFSFAPFINLNILHNDRIHMDVRGKLLYYCEAKLNY